SSWASSRWGSRRRPIPRARQTPATSARSRASSRRSSRERDMARSRTLLRMPRRRTPRSVGARHRSGRYSSAGAGSFLARCILELRAPRRPAPDRHRHPGRATVRAEERDSRMEPAEAATPSLPLPPAAAVPAAAAKLAHPLTLPHFRNLWLGSTISLLGDQFYLVALPWLVLQLTRSSVALGTILMTAAVPRAALMLLGGAVTDRI